MFVRQRDIHVHLLETLCLFVNIFLLLFCSKVYKTVRSVISLLVKDYFYSSRVTHIHCVSKNIPDILDCNLKTNYQILIIFGTNIRDTTCHETAIQFSTSLSFCFCTTWEKHNQQNVTFYPMRHDCLIKIRRKNTFCSHFRHFG